MAHRAEQEGESALEEECSVSSESGCSLAEAVLNSKQGNSVRRTALPSGIQLRAEEASRQQRGEAAQRLLEALRMRREVPLS